MHFILIALTLLAPATALGQSSTDFTGAGNSALILKGKKVFNPDMGVNILGFYSKSNRPSDIPNGFRFQEAELQFTADVDPYLRAVTLFAVRPKAGLGETGFEIDAEEVYIETLSLPKLILKAGKFRTALGKHNLLHTHAFPFIDAPLINQRLLGDEGYNDMGLSASVLIPAPWFMELTVQGTAANSAQVFRTTSTGEVAGVATFKNLWDLSEAVTLELGLSGAKGKNQFDSISNAYDANLTLKWRPSEGGKYQALVWSTEYLGGRRGANPEGERLGGIASWVQYQFAQRWWIQARSEVVGIPKEDTEVRTTKESALLGFFPSEFSGYRLQYDHARSQSGPDEHRVAIQWNVSIGAHPAHGY